MKKLINIIGRHGILDIFMDVSHTLEMTICVVNQLKNDSYRKGLCLVGIRENIIEKLYLLVLVEGI